MITTKQKTIVNSQKIKRKELKYMNKKIINSQRKIAKKKGKGEPQKSKKTSNKMVVGSTSL